jgi:hypothetical protein
MQLSCALGHGRSTGAAAPGGSGRLRRARRDGRSGPRPGRPVAPAADACIPRTKRPSCRGDAAQAPVVQGGHLLGAITALAWAWEQRSEARSPASALGGCPPVDCHAEVARVDCLFAAHHRPRGCAAFDSVSNTRELPSVSRTRVQLSRVRRLARHRSAGRYCFFRLRVIVFDRLATLPVESVKVTVSVARSMPAFRSRVRPCLVALTLTG